MKTFDLVEREILVQGPNQVPPIDTSSFVKRKDLPFNTEGGTALYDEETETLTFIF